jgi:MoxR-like ATPase
MSAMAGEPGVTASTSTERTDGPSSWWRYTGTGERGRSITFPDPPEWRRFTTPAVRTPEGMEAPVPEESDETIRRLGRFPTSIPYAKRRHELDLINAAIYLRRPMLITGKAGTGKSTLARSIAVELGLGKVLHWPITSRSSLDYGLYRYDAIGRLQELSLVQAAARRAGTPEPEPTVPDIGRFLRLGPLGSALLPRHRPRVLLIDEIDKSDIDLPNDLLTVFEDGFFEIPELVRMRSTAPVFVMEADSDVTVGITGGVVRCNEFPIIVMTSNGERDFPPAFLRRCIRIRLKAPDDDRVAEIVGAHLGPAGIAAGQQVMADFVRRVALGEDLAADQLMNAIHMITTGERGPDEDISTLIEELIRPLNESDR